MAHDDAGAAESLRSLDELRRRTRLARSGHWFVLLVFGIIVLGAGAFNPLFSGFNLGRWATVYWAVALVVGFAVVVAFYRHRARAVGVGGRIWPMVVVGLGLLLLVLLVDSPQSSFPPLPDLWIRGTGALLIVALGIAVLAGIERSWGFGIFTAGFFGLALLSCLYDEVNIFGRLGLGVPFNGGGSALPNLLLPGVYLVLGGVGFWVAGRRTRRAPLSLA